MRNNLRTIANRENAKRSTGPRTPEGKQISSRNAVRHGLTGQRLFLSDEDLPYYTSFCQGFLDEWQPQGLTETNLVHSLATHQWRLHAAQAREISLYDEAAPALDPELSAELDRSSRYVSRIQRDYQIALKQLQALQTARKARQAAEIKTASDIRNTMNMQGRKWDPDEDGFVLTHAQLDRYAQRDRREQAADKGRISKFNLQDFLRYGGVLEPEP